MLTQLFSGVKIAVYRKSGADRAASRRNLCETVLECFRVVGIPCTDRMDVRHIKIGEDIRTAESLVRFTVCLQNNQSIFSEIKLAVETGICLGQCSIPGKLGTLDRGQIRGGRLGEGSCEGEKSQKLPKGS